MPEKVSRNMPEKTMEKRQKRGEKGHAWKKINSGQENVRNRRLWIPLSPRKRQPQQVTDRVRFRRHGAVVRVSVVDHMAFASSRPIGVR